MDESSTSSNVVPLRAPKSRTPSQQPPETLPPATRSVLRSPDTAGWFDGLTEEEKGRAYNQAIYLAALDLRAKMKRDKAEMASSSRAFGSALMIDQPPPFAPRAELEAFIRELETSQFRNHPDARQAVAQAKRDLAAPRPWEDKASSAKTP